MHAVQGEVMTSILLAALLGVGDVSAHSGNHHTHRAVPVVVNNRRHIRPAPVRHHRWVWVSGHWKIKNGNIVWVSGHWNLRRVNTSHPARYRR